MSCLHPIEWYSDVVEPDTGREETAAELEMKQLCYEILGVLNGASEK